MRLVIKIFAHLNNLSTRKSGQTGIFEEDLFSMNCDGLIILSGDLESDIGQAILKRPRVCKRKSSTMGTFFARKFFLSNKQTIQN